MSNPNNHEFKAKEQEGTFWEQSNLFFCLQRMRQELGPSLTCVESTLQNIRSQNLIASLFVHPLSSSLAKTWGGSGFLFYLLKVLNFVHALGSMSDYLREVE